MKVLGISGSPRRGQTTDRLVQAVLKGCECETAFVSLAGKHICPCIACLGCVPDNVCTVRDDLADLRPAIVEADAYVIGAPNYFHTVNALTHCFLERWYQFRHREGKAVAGKPAVAVGVGGGDGEPAAAAVRTFLEYNQMECVGSVTAQGPACCFTCGYGEECRVGAIHMFFGPGTEITEAITPRLEKQPDALAAAEGLGKALSDRLGRFAAAT
jgi:multimeric flavodoxin WrbA